MLPNEILHVMYAGVTEELRARERLINRYGVNNEKMFTEKTQALKEKEVLHA